MRLLPDPGRLGAVVLAGGRSRRLDGVPKATLPYRGTTLLGHTIAEISAAGADGGVVLVGPETLARHVVHPGVGIVRERPAFAGPAAALAAGLEALAPEVCWVLVLACDMPEVGRLLPFLLTKIRDGGGSPGTDGFLSVDRGREQPLASVYRCAPLRAAVAKAASAGILENAAVRALLASLDLARVEVPSGSTADVDSWADARRFGILPGCERTGTVSQDELLHEWVRSLLELFEIPGTDVDVEAVLSVAGKAAHAVVRPAAPLTTFVAGYAAGLATGLGQAGSAVAMDSALSAAAGLATKRQQDTRGNEQDPRADQQDG